MAHFEHQIIANRLHYQFDNGRIKIWVKPIEPIPDFWDNLGKLLLDLAKLTFASFILGGILKDELPQYVLIAAGCIVFVLLAVIGLILTSRKKNRG